MNISRKEIAKILAKEFYNDTLYTHILPNDESRLKALECFFYSYINMYPIGTIVAPTKSKEAIGYIFYDDNGVSKLKQLKDLVIYSTTLSRMMKYISVREFVFFIKAIHNNSSAWIKEFIKGKFIHIDLIVVDENHRNKGLAKAIINDIFEEADNKNLLTTLETQNPVNVEIYKKLGFKVVKEQRYETLFQYCMIREPKTK